MLEMPEIETIRRSLEPHLTGKTIKRADVLLARQIKWPEPDQFVARILLAKIAKLDRVGKYLLLRLDNGVSLVFHLRMTGQLIYHAADSKAEGHHERLVLSLDDGAKLVFSDTRTFGTVYAMENEEMWRITGLAEMGPEPLSAEFTAEYLSGAVKGKKGKIKSFMLNQSYIGGLGNIYVDEALFLSGILPTRVADSLTEAEVKKLHKAINKVIEDGINDGGTTFRDYRDGNGGKGSHQEKLFVYGRDGEQCRKCGTIIEKTKVGGRGTHYCPKCQK